MSELRFELYYCQARLDSSIDKLAKYLRTLYLRVPQSLTKCKATLLKRKTHAYLPTEKPLLGPQPQNPTTYLCNHT